MHFVTEANFIYEITISLLKIYFEIIAQPLQDTGHNMQGDHQQLLRHKDVHEINYFPAHFSPERICFFKELVNKVSVSFFTHTDILRYFAEENRDALLKKTRILPV
jgi:hypothetical protein